MSGVAKKLMGTTAAGGGFTAIEDVFSTYLYTGNGSTQTITNGIDLAGEGGLTWIKGRSSDESHNLYDTERGAGEYLNSATNGGSTFVANGLTSFNSDGFSVGSNFLTSRSGVTYASWTFRKAPRFFDVVTYSGNGVAGREIAHNLGTTVGSIFIKRTDNSIARDWAVYHRGNTAAPETDFLVLNLTNATADNATYWNDTAPTDSVFTVGSNINVNASDGTYVAYLFAHDPLGPSEDGSDGLISCGSYTLPASGDVFVDLGWEPQWVLFKTSDSSSDWKIVDSMRGFTNNNAVQPALEANNSGAEGDTGFANIFSTGFGRSGFGVAQNYIYIAIRRGPMRVPESGTEVFAVENGNGGGSATNPEFVSGFPVDAALIRGLGVANNQLYSRLTANKYLSTDQTDAEITNASAFSMASNEGWYLGSTTWTSWMFRRAPNFFDVVAYTGDGVGPRNVPHSLGVVPEMMINKDRTQASGWFIYHKDLPLDSATQTASLLFDAGTPGGYGAWGEHSGQTATTFEIAPTNDPEGNNKLGNAHVTYLFATLPGVSKVGSYTGNGTSQTIDCGFTSGARFVLIKRTDSTGDWYVWDTARGIVAANDPHLSLNTTAAEVTTDDSVDPDSSGFIVNQVVATNINVSAASYIFYAIA